MKSKSIKENNSSTSYDNCRKGDLVSPESTLALNDLVSSKKKETFVLPTGHVGLCTSTTAHMRLWPKVAAWILSNHKLQSSKTDR